MGKIKNEKPPPIIKERTITPSNYVIPAFNKTFGAVSDTHLCSTFAREDALKWLYSYFEDQGIETVVHCGNMVDGYLPRINGGYVKESSIDGQTNYTIDRYPTRSGIRTIYITGDDHEGWWQKEGFNWGKHLELEANDQGRTDLIYAGHVEADLRIKRNGHYDIVRLQHPGGGSAYAVSYKAQKQVESFEGGEKPAIFIYGHYHVADFLPYRNVYAIGLPGLQAQTVFGRKKGLRMEVGGAVIRCAQDSDGHVASCTVQFIIFYDRGFYKKFIVSDNKEAKIIEI